MTKLDLFNKLMAKAKANGYSGPDYKYQIGYILDGTNIYSLLFRRDFAIAIWGENETIYSSGEGLHMSKKNTARWEVALVKMATSTDKWKFIEDNINLH